MAISMTNGYDIVLQISETALGSMVAGPFAFLLLALNHAPFDANRPDGPQLGLVPRSSSIGPATELDFDAPGTDPNRVRLLFHLRASRVQSTSSSPSRALGPATLSVVGTFAVEPVRAMDGTVSQWALILRLAWSDPASTVTWESAIDPAVLAEMGQTQITLGTALRDAVRRTWAPLVAPLGVTIDEPLHTAVEPQFGDPALTITDLRVHADRDASAGTGDSDFLSVLLQVTPGPGSPTTPDASVPPQIAPGGNVALILSTPFIEREVCRILRTRFGGSPSSADPCTLPAGGETVTINGDEYTLHGISTHVNDADDSLGVHMELSRSGIGWRALATVDVTIRLEVRTMMTGGVPTATLVPVAVGEPSANVDVFLEWWLYAIGLVVAAILFIINPAVGLIFGVAYIAVLLIVSAIAGAVAEGQASSGITAGIAGAASTLPPALTALLGMNVVQSVALDDLAVSFRHVPPPPPNLRVVEGNQSARPGQGFDLDAGSVVDSAAADGNVDLQWQLQGGTYVLNPRNGARFFVLSGRTFADVSLDDLERATFPTGASLSASAIPVGPAGSVPVNALLLAVRTSAARLAKCLVWWDATGALHLYGATFDNAAAEASLGVRWSLLERVEIGRGYDDVLLANYVDYRVARRGQIHAYASGLVSPLRYAWQLGDVPLSGTGTLAGGSVSYAVRDGLCEISTALGAAVRGPLRVSITDALGVTATSTLNLDQAGTAREYGPSALEKLFEKLSHIQRIDQLPIPMPEPDPSLAAVRSEVVLRRALQKGMAESFAAAKIQESSIRVF